MEKTKNWKSKIIIFNKEKYLVEVMSYLETYDRGTVLRYMVVVSVPGCVSFNSIKIIDTHDLDSAEDAYSDKSLKTEMIRLTGKQNNLEIHDLDALEDSSNPLTFCRNISVEEFVRYHKDSASYSRFRKCKVPEHSQFWWEEMIGSNWSYINNDKKRIEIEEYYQTLKK